MDFLETSNLLKTIFIVLLHIGGAALCVIAGRWIAAWSRPKLRPILVRANLAPSLMVLSETAYNYAIWLVTVMVALVVLGVPLETVLLVAVGVLVVLGIALQESLRDLAATINFLAVENLY